MTYKVDLEMYNGPMDLLLYLIRREEVDVRDLPVARIADQYVAYLHELQALDIELAGEFVVMAATLLELKSRALLPRVSEADEDEETEEDEEDPRETLIRQLIEYRRYKGAAGHLSDRGRDMARRFPRRFDDRLLRELETAAEDVPAEPLLEGVELWDLISAFSGVMRTLGYAKPREVVYDDTPLEDAAAELVQRLGRERTVRFTDLFAGGRGVDYCIAMFLAILELVRQRRIGAEQDEDAGDLRIYLRDPDAEEPVKRRKPRGAAKSKEALARKHPRRPSGRTLLDDAEEAAELEKTEFDEILDAVHVPEVRADGPIYTDDELMGRETPDEEEAQADEADEAGPAGDEAGDDRPDGQEDEGGAAPDDAADEAAAEEEREGPDDSTASHP
ncbi:MAG: segregation/condensation protein A [Phycisphaerae bacterium]